MFEGGLPGYRGPHKMNVVLGWQSKFVSATSTTGNAVLHSKISPLFDRHQARQGDISSFRDSIYLREHLDIS